MLKSKKELLTALEKLRESEDRYPYLGICGNIEYSGLENYWCFAADEIDRLISLWPEIAVNENKVISTIYPVEGSQKEYKRDSEDETLWENPRRLALLEFMIKTLKEEISEMENKQKTSSLKKLWWKIVYSATFHCVVGGILVVALVTAFFAIQAWLTHLTIEESTIHPTFYSYSSGSKGKSVREVFAEEGEFRIKDSWYPYNRESAHIANVIQQAVTKKQTCRIKTWGFRYPMLSMFKVVYEVKCQ